MLGAIAGDMIGSPYEARPIKTRDFPLFQRRSRFTDDSVLTVATAWALLAAELQPDRADFGAAYKRFGNEYPHAGYGGMFMRWLLSPRTGPYGSFGNGSAMRVSPVGWAFDSQAAVAQEARNSAACTHDHPEGIKGAQATAVAVFIGRGTASSHAEADSVRERIRREIQEGYGYDLHRSVDEIRPRYRFDPTCQGTVPEAIIACLDSSSFEDAVRNAVSLGGDSDTLACITGAIAEALYGGVPDDIESEVVSRLPEELLSIVRRFRSRTGEAGSSR